MIFRRNATQLGTGRSRGIWPVLALILAAVLVPTACVLWFMLAAMENERLAVRQRLMDVFRGGLLDAQRRLDDYWQSKLRELQETNSLPAPQAFHRLVTQHEFSSVVVYDANGNLAYPIDAFPRPDELGPDRPAELEQAWGEARELERAGDPNAAKAYERIAGAETNVNFQARAFQAQARCLMRSGNNNDMVLAILADELAKDKYRAARDEAGRLIAPDALLAALRAAPAEDAVAREAILRDLRARLHDYSGPPMPSAQRMFLLDELPARTYIDARLLGAERLAAEYADAHPAPAGFGGTLAPAGVRNAYVFASPDGRVAGLMSFISVSSIIAGSLQMNSNSFGAFVEIQEGPASLGRAEPFLDMPMSKYMPDHRWSIRFNAGTDPFAAAAEKRNAAYLWTAVLGIALIALMAASLASYLGRQMRLTRLKNDLIATVSHELKTPLASMRVLVDTLREGRCADEKQASEYFDLIARENHRLSRLIDNFLTFSRMERNKRAFDFDDVDAGEVVRAAAASVGERFAAPGASLLVDVAPDLPVVRADRDAVETVVLNLLDNAWKYSGDEKTVRVRASADGCGAVTIEVSDNGIGMSRRAQRRIFDKFYQADQTLARRAGGCGLGLAIVKFILDAHGGTITVKSLPGKGSTFAVRLPVSKKEGFNAESAKAAED